MAATTPATPVMVSVPPLNRGGYTPVGQKNILKLGAGAALLIAVIAAAVTWGKTAEYKVLYSNLSDKDGGAILAQLTQMNIPYKHADGGGAILVPVDQVHDARLKLASQGLPKGSTVGFELLENQRFGATQFQEQINFQRGLEGELAKSIQSLSSVQSARVHLALPKQSAFMREQQKPSASVILNLYPGRTLDRAQVAGIVHLVSSSVPDLPMKNVTALDQHGTLLSNASDVNGTGGLDPEKLNYVQQLEQGYIRRVTDLLEPIVGRENVRAQVTADVDFSVIEQTAETFKPNVGEATVRSSALSDSNSGAGSAAQGVPGALSNQPPANPTAPLQGAAGSPAAASAQNSSASPVKREQTTNYEVDKTIRLERRPVGAVKRLSAAVVVNNNRVVDKQGKVTMQPLSDADLAKITSLVREAVGFSQTRGDSLNVVNVPFNVDEKTIEPELPLWKQPENISIAKDAGKGFVLLTALLVLVFGLVRPAMRSFSERQRLIPSMADGGNGLAAPDALYLPGRQAGMLASDNSAAQLQEVRQLAKQDPATVANVVRAWVNKDG